MPKRESILGTFACQLTNKRSLGIWNDQKKSSLLLPWVYSIPNLSEKKGYIDEYGHKTLDCTKKAAFIYVSECMNAHTNQSHLISLDERMKSRQIVSYNNN